MNAELDKTKVLALAHLCNVLEWAKGNRGRQDINPYGVPEVQAALQFLAELQGIDDHLDAVTGTKMGGP